MVLERACNDFEGGVHTNSAPTYGLHVAVYGIYMGPR